MHGDHDTHTLEFLGCSEAGLEEWFCPTCGRHMLLRSEPTLEQTILAEGDAQASHSNRTAGLQLAALNALTAELQSAAPTYGAAGSNSGALVADAFIDCGDPETNDGLAPWIMFLKRLG